MFNPTWSGAHAFLLEAMARDALGDAAAAERALERSLELAAPERMLWMFLAHRPEKLLERQANSRRAQSAFASVILAELRGVSRAPIELGTLVEPLTDSEMRVLRLLPSGLSATEIAKELYLSVHTVKTHMRHVYTKLDAHRRTQAIERAASLGLLSPQVARL